MSGRSWFYASEGKQQGPFPEIQLREFIGRGAIMADTLVWTAGMANWQRAAEIPGLFSGDAVAPSVPHAGSALPSAGAYGGGPLSIDFGIWEFIWRSLVCCIGLVLIIPTPWAVVMYCRWIVSCVHVPERPNLTFTGRPVTLMWYFAALVLFSGMAMIGSELLNNLMIIVQVMLYWLVIRWFVANIGSNGQPGGLTFSGSVWGYIGWNILAFVSILTIIGWAWVYTAQFRWMCRHIEGTRREIVFNATGLEFLWRSLATIIACLFIIPIPWVLRWFIRWQVSQLVLVERHAHAKA
jgi:GYF domain 2